MSFLAHHISWKIRLLVQLYVALSRQKLGWNKIWTLIVLNFGALQLVYLRQSFYSFFTSRYPPSLSEVERTSKALSADDVR